MSAPKRYHVTPGANVPDMVHALRLKEHSIIPVRRDDQPSVICGYCYGRVLQNHEGWFHT